MGPDAGGMAHGDRHRAADPAGVVRSGQMIKHPR
jgi:hypothetical protein